MFQRLYIGGFTSVGGTLLQLQNMLNCCNVATDVSGHFNATIDFVELVTNCHVIAAAMSFFGMKDITSAPTSNALPLDIHKCPVKR